MTGLFPFQVHLLPRNSVNHYKCSRKKYSKRNATIEFYQSICSGYAPLVVRANVRKEMTGQNLNGQNHQLRRNFHKYGMLSTP